MACTETLLYTAGFITLAVTIIRWFLKGRTYKGRETMVGKTVVITGANDGIGKETARDLAMRGARIIMGSRDMAKGDKACQEMIRETNNTNIDNRKLDLSSMASVREFANDVLRTESKIDILINNAGVLLGSCKRRLTEDGLEYTIATNHFGPFLLTNLLLDRLEKSAPSRIVMVSSFVYKSQTALLNLSDINSERSYNSTTAYYRSKLANILHTFELSKRLQGTGVTVNAVNPGTVSTSISRDSDQVYSHQLTQFLLKVVGPYLLKSSEEGAQTTLRVALDKRLEGVNGKYFSDTQEEVVKSVGQDDYNAKKLWEISMLATTKQD